MYKIGLKLWSTNTDFYLKEAERLFDMGVYDYIELYVVPETLDTLPQWKRLKVPYIMHNAHFAHGFNLAKKDHEKRNAEIYDQTKRFADELNAQYIIFHGGIDGTVEETARQLSAINDPRALIENKPFVALPNRMGGNFCRGATHDELKLIIETAKCGFCLDVGHAVCSANSQSKDPYSFLRELAGLNPAMFHLSDITDMTSRYDAHPHLGSGQLDIARLKREIFPADAIISVETVKDSKENLNDFEKDSSFLRRRNRENKKIALVVGAGEESIFGICTAQKKGFYVIAFDGNPKAAGLKHADEFYVSDIRDKQNIINRLNKRQPNFIVPVPIGRALLVSGELNDYYKMPGASAKECDICTDKFKFHQVLSQHNLRNCECVLVNKNSKVNFIHFPAVLKPRFGSGSRAVSVIGNKKELTENLQNLSDEDFICETCASGQEYGLDAAVIDKKIRPVLLRKKENTPFPYRQCTGYYAVIPDEQPELFNNIITFMQKVVDVIGFSDTLLHADILYNNSDTFIIEMSPRPSGHHLHNEFTKIAAGVDMLSEYINIINGYPGIFSSKKIHHTLISYFNFNNCIVEKVPDAESLLKKYPLKKYECNIKNNEKMEQIKDGASLMKRGYYILQAESDEVLKEIRNNLLSEFKINYV